MEYIALTILTTIIPANKAIKSKTTIPKTITAIVSNILIT